jgi:hypothetical protein
MHAVSRRHVLVGAMLAATGAIAVTPFTSRPAHLPVVSTETRLVDAGDPGHVAAIDSLIAPFPAFDDGLGGLDYQLTGLLASELPISASCAVTTCYPIVPPDVITGITESTATSGSAMRCSALISGCFATFLRLPLPVRTVCCPGTPSTRPLTAASTP